MNSFAPSFYHMDRVVAEESTESAVLREKEEEDDTLTTIELAAPKMPVYSMYIQPGMTAPAYNSLPTRVEQLPVDYFLPKTVQKKTLVQEKEEPRVQEKKMLVEQIPVDHFTKEHVIPERQYKESHYLGFKNDVQPAYRSQQKHVVFAPSSRLVKSIEVAKLPESQIDTEYSSIEGDAFRPVLMPRSEYQFDKLNELVSYQQ